MLPLFIHVVHANVDNWIIHSQYTRLLIPPPTRPIEKSHVIVGGAVEKSIRGINEKHTRCVYMKDIRPPKLSSSPLLNRVVEQAVQHITNVAWSILDVFVGVLAELYFNITERGIGIAIKRIFNPL